MPYRQMPPDPYAATWVEHRRSRRAQWAIGVASAFMCAAAFEFAPIDILGALAVGFVLGVVFLYYSRFPCPRCRSDMNERTHCVACGLVFGASERVARPERR